MSMSERQPGSDEGHHEIRSGKILGLDQFALLEIGIFFFIALVFDHFLFGGNRYWYTNPHPFWLIVILTSVQHGGREGLLAAVCSTVALLAFNVPEMPESQSIMSQFFEVAYHPVMWIATSVFVGGFRARQLRQQGSIYAKVAETEAKLERITESYDELNTQKNRLETYVAGQLTTATELYQTARKVEKEEPAKIIVSALELVNTILNPKKVSIFLLVNDMLQAGIQKGWEEQEDSYLRFFRSESPLFQAIVAKKQFLNVTHLEDERVLLGQGVLAGPLIDRTTGDITGMLKVEQLGFLNLNITSVQSFQVLCGWIGSLLTHAKHLREKDDGHASVRHGLRSSRLYEQHLDFLKSLSSRLHFDVTVVRIQLRNPQLLDGPSLSRTANVVGNLVKEALRFTDFAFDYQRGWSYMILLPGTDEEQARVVADKMAAGLDEGLAEIKDADYFIEVEKIV